MSDYIYTLEQELKTVKAQRDVLIEALKHIVEYWNRDYNDYAMSDALNHIIDTAEEAIAKAKGEE